MKTLLYTISDKFQIENVTETDQQPILLKGYKTHELESINKDALLSEILKSTIQNFDRIEIKGQVLTMDILFDGERIGIIDRKNKSKNIQIRSTLANYHDCYQIQSDINSFTLFKRIFKAILFPVLLRNSLRTKLDEAMIKAGMDIDDQQVYLHTQQYKNALEISYHELKFEYFVDSNKLKVLGFHRDYEDGYSFTEGIEEIESEIVKLQKDKENLGKLITILEKD